MGMTLTLYAVAEADLKRIFDDPPLAHLLWEGTPSSADALPRQECDLDKSWNAIHFTLTGDADGDTDLPLGFLLTGGRPVPEVDLGHGPIRAFGPEAVQGLAELLAAIPPEEFLARFDHAAMREEDVYCVGPDPDEERAYHGAHYRDLHRFLPAAAARGDALIVVL